MVANPGYMMLDGELSPIVSMFMADGEMCFEAMFTQAHYAGHYKVQVYDPNMRETFSILVELHHNILDGDTLELTLRVSMTDSHELKVTWANR